jgi:hypothetical protein
MAKKHITIDELAAASQEQFLALEKKMDEGFKHTASKEDVRLILSALENLTGQMTDIKHSLPSALDFARLEGRMELVERKLGISPTTL